MPVRSANTARSRTHSWLSTEDASSRVPGDGVLLEFPSVVDAVECAVAVQTVMAERNQGVPENRLMQFRIGVNLGDILIEGNDILGDGVNVASRLEGIADTRWLYVVFGLRSGQRQSRCRVH